MSKESPDASKDIVDDKEEKLEKSLSEQKSSSAIQAPKKQEIEVSADDKKSAKGFLYSCVFHNCFGRCAIFPSMVIGAIPILFYLVFGEMVNVLTDPLKTVAQKSDEMITYLIYFAAVAVGSGIFKFLDSFLWIRCGTQISVEIRSNLFQSMMRSEITFFDLNPIGGILTLLSEDSVLVQTAFGTTKGVQIQNVTQFLTGIILAFVYSWRQALIQVASFPVMMFVTALFLPKVGKHAITKFIHTSASMTIAEEALANIRTIKSFNKEDSESQRFATQVHLSTQADRKIGFLITGMMCFVMTLVWGTLIGNLYYGGYLVTKKLLLIGDVFSVFGFSMFGGMGLFMLQNSMQDEEKAVSAGARILKLTNHQPEIPFEGGNVIDNFIGSIEFKNVSFKYPTRDVYVLKNVSFKVESNQMIALVGHSGSGKSTCVQLIERYYDITEGVILLDGVDIKTLDPRWLHRQIALVSQEPTLFKMSIKDNIKYGAQDATDDEVTAAATVANALKFIQKRDKGFDDDVGEKGSALSGGQKQRIAIARAVIRNPKILITDEATSALDAESEKKVQLALDKVMDGRTAVVVAHRLSTIRNAQVIYVFDSGEIKEIGTHDELVKKGGFYFNLVRRQLSKEQQDQHEQSTHSITTPQTVQPIQTEEPSSSFSSSKSSSSSQK